MKITSYIITFMIFISIFLFFYLSSHLLTGFGINTIGTNCSCESCITDRGMEDEWFSLRYNHNLQPMLNKKNCVLNKTVNIWWRSLQSTKKSQRSFEALVGKLFSYFPNQAHYSDVGPERCRTCAVVGNSGNLLGSHYGSLIDFHDFVIRINEGPTKGYEKDVGSKTTHRIMYPESAGDVDSSTHLVFFPFKILDLEWLISAFTTKHITHTYRKVRSSIKANKNKVMILHPAFIKYVYDNWLQKHGRYPSTGFITIILALHICDEVRVFGFGAKSSGHWHHYFDTSLTPFKKGVHPGDFENNTIHHLHQIKKITMFKGWN